MTNRQRQLRLAYWRSFAAALALFTLFAVAMEYVSDERPAIYQR